jgi:Rho-binding antiterminator
MTSPYSPIACAIHDELLAAATRREERDIAYTDEQGARRVVRSRILDVYTKGSEEFLRLSTGETVRLDRLAAVEGTALGGQ